MNNYCNFKINKHGFTLIELLIVVAVIAILSALVFVALNPLARFQDTRNTQRWTDVNAILDAIKLDQIDNGGSYLTAITNAPEDVYYQIGTNAGLLSVCHYPDIDLESSGIDLTGLVTEGYLPSMPVDPINGTQAETHYYFKKDSGGYVVIGACDEEQGTDSIIQSIVVSR